MNHKKYCLVLCAVVAGIIFFKTDFNSEVSMPLSLTVLSDSFLANAQIPLKHGYLNENISPQLSWSAGPTGTKSYAIICQDPDAPRKDPWVHWVVFNIPADIISLHEGVANQASFNNGMQQGRNDYPDAAKQIGWGGPNPPSGTHHYHFTVYAIDSILTELVGQIPSKQELLHAIKQHILAQGELIGTYSAK